VQWHPEDTAATDAQQAGVFRSFVEAILKGIASRREVS
jgi:gamma-glutamyl-gamma-aminobutyrate hydrolase PuuD